MRAWPAATGKRSTARQGNPDSRAGFNRGRLSGNGKVAAAADRKRAETEATRILTQMLKRHERFTPVQPAGIQPRRPGRRRLHVAGASPRSTLDYHHECAWNLVSNCRGAQRLAYVDLSNNEQDFMSCKAELRRRISSPARPPIFPASRSSGPKATRRLVLGDVYEQPDKSAMTLPARPFRNWPRTPRPENAARASKAPSTRSSSIRPRPRTRDRG